MTECLLLTQDLTKTYPMNGLAIKALRGVSLTIERGEFVAVVGPSGCGKSTLLNLLGGLMTPTAGHVILAGQDLTTLEERERAELRRARIGFIFQAFDLLSDLTTAENVEFPLVLASVPARERYSRVQHLLDSVGLVDKADHLPDELSGGQKQRVAIARALANRPALLLADEPTGNLDSVTASEIMDVLSDLNHRDGLTLVMVTHAPGDAARAGRVIHLRDGQVEREQGE